MSAPKKPGGVSVEAFGRFLTRYADWAMGVGVLGLMVTLLVPLPPQALDILLAFNITISVLLLLVTMSVRSAAPMPPPKTMAWAPPSVAR